MQFIDSHIHLDFAALTANRENLLIQARNLGVRRFVVPATTSASWTDINRLHLEHKDVIPTYGLHPYWIQQHTESDLIALEKRLNSTDKPAAVGEIGLDFFLEYLDKAKQLLFFESQLQLAQQHSLPVILHVRKAVDAILMHCRNTTPIGGIAHSYNGSLQQAYQFLDLNIKLGFGGAITYSRATKLRKLVSDLPLEALCIETDAPDQPVQRLSGQPNTPCALLDVFDVVCSLRKESEEEIANALWSNTHHALQLIDE